MKKKTCLGGTIGAVGVLLTSSDRLSDAKVPALYLGIVLSKLRPWSDAARRAVEVQSQFSPVDLRFMVDYDSFEELICDSEERPRQSTSAVRPFSDLSVGFYQCVASMILHHGARSCM